MAEHFAHVVMGSGPGILLAHGGGGSIAGNYGPILDDLATTHTVIGPDYPGSGDTPRSPEPLVLDDVADALVRTAVDAGVDRFTVLGYSLGTAVAVRIAVRYPERVTGLVLTAGFTYPDNRMRLAVQVWRDLLAAGDRTLLARYLTLLGTGATHLNGLSPADLEAGVAALAGFIPEGSPEHVGLVAGVDTRADLPKVTAPTLVVATTEDALATPEHSRQLAAGIPDAEIVEIAAGHGIATEARDEWLAAIRTLLARVG
ncbi:alpha/beta fold hydrolase [Pseudonocardia cypriaca]|uniref:Pimeloyl-ACP methyl ester carboxylesterase n=1 Tax=Pseudonocardia cypriaca TaxID=882449 RepID=A0A543FX87_9PSEU|nr:alpha/beta hydrolase [Pseudonocardia cypriaca]TQM38384.1 pimeloyl-ACP methyl ester carboxylesterase [Pseudonocardia cypriaca]